MAVLEKLGTIDKARLIADYQLLHQTNPITRLARHYRDRLFKESNLDQLVTLPPAALRSRIDALVNGMILEEGRVISGRDRAEVINIILDETVGLGPLEALMRDPSITEIMVNWVKAGDVMMTPKDSRASMSSVAERFKQRRRYGSRTAITFCISSTGS